MHPLDTRTSETFRTHTCGDLRGDDVGTEARLAGWVHTIRDHGGVMFVDLRDQYGVTQVVVSGEDALRLRRESVISAAGKVRARDEETYNPNLATGKVELKADTIDILGECRRVLPFEIESSEDTKEELRLKYRYLDLRNPRVRDRMLLRSEVIKDVRTRMDALGFSEIQTPILANSSPEGARDYLVPSRKHEGMFYALPQAPQQFKQLLMVAGFDRYYQIAPCFRDEDARLDRSPGEFYQLDFEMAFATQEDVFSIAERVLTDVFRKFSDKPVTEPPYARIPYREAMLRYGTDKPDLRNPLVIVDLSDFFAGVDFKPFQCKIVRAIRVPGAASRPRSFFKAMEKFALGIGMKGLGYITVQDDRSYKGPIDKFLSDAQKKELAEICSVEGQALAPSDVLYFISDEPKLVAGHAGQIRAELAAALGIIDENRYEFCFITDYPMYEWNEEAGKIDFTHNPFSMPQGGMDALLNKNPEDILAWQYDIVCNGVELSSGAVRNHRPDVMVKAFEIAGYDERALSEAFGALYGAFSYGAPPHAGMAPGIDRIVMLLSGDENIREVIPFPLDSNARNLMLGAPSEVTEQQLRETHIKVTGRKRETK
ncbi:MAG: aspartate--tRNA ligase [Clostridiales Family XIII bacterium]|nr:aspartate--tRNA ligase [Clostridiales Family XIII bacterium]